MKKYTFWVFRSLFLIIVIILIGCQSNSMDTDMNREIKIIFLHHSTGKAIWNGNSRNIRSLSGKIMKKLFKQNSQTSEVPFLIKQYNKANGTNYIIEEQDFPKQEIYGWSNYPYDYYNIWVKSGDVEEYMNEPTLKKLSSVYDVIIFKHCFPVSSIQQDQDTANIDSDIKTLANYKLQYGALKGKMHEYANTKFIVWTGAALVKSQTTEEEALRAREFFNWVKNEWDQENDNIFIWDFYELETEGGNYMKEDYAVSPTNSHPNRNFSEHAAGLLVNRIIDIIESEGKTTSLTGEKMMQ